DLGAGVLDHHVFEGAGVVGVVVAAVAGLGLAFGAFHGDVTGIVGEGQAAAVGRQVAGVGALVGDAEAVDDHAAPLAHGVVGHGAFHVGAGGEGDGLGGGTLGDDLRAAMDHDEVGGVLQGHGGAGLHGQFRALAAGLEGEVRLVAFLVLADEQAAAENMGAVIGQVGKGQIHGQRVVEINEIRAVNAVGAVHGALAGHTILDVGGTGVGGRGRSGAATGVVVGVVGIVDVGAGGNFHVAAATAATTRQDRGHYRQSKQTLFHGTDSRML